jgi:hypothetical protein
MSVLTAPATRTPRRARTRVLGIVGAVAAALVAWGVGALLGADYWIADSQGTARVDLLATTGSAAIIGLLGWAVLAVAERVTRRGRTAWTVLAVGVLALSIVPIGLVDATPSTRIGLALIHLAVAAVLVPAFTRR